MQTAILKLSIRYVFVLMLFFNLLRYFIHKNYIFTLFTKNSKSFVEQNIVLILHEKVLLNKNIVLILHDI